MLTRSSNIFSPSLLPPPFFVRKLRPSSASRASKLNIMKLISPALADGSRTTVYLPGSSAFASAERFALSIAMRMSLFASKSRMSCTLRATQPEPRPSSVRTVQVKSATVRFW